jgi:hypothetical protein
VEQYWEARVELISALKNGAVATLVPHTLKEEESPKCVGTRKHQKFRIGGFLCQIRIFPGDLSIVQGFYEV